MIVVGIDSAELSGLAVVARPPGGREQLMLSKTARIRTAADIDQVVAELRGFAPDVVAVEEAFVATYPGGNVHTGLALAVLQGRWQQAWESAGYPTVTVPPGMWRRGVLSGLLGSRARRAELKAAAQTWVRATFRAEVGEDEADAIALATFTLRNASRAPAGRAA